MTTTTLNSTLAMQVTGARWPRIMLFSRTLLFLGWQAVIAFIYLLLVSMRASSGGA